MSIPELLLAFAILVTVILFFGPVLVVMSITGCTINIHRSFILDMSSLNARKRALVALVGLITWLAVLVPLIVLAVRAPLGGTTPAAVASPAATVIQGLTAPTLTPAPTGTTVSATLQITSHPDEDDAIASEVAGTLAVVTLTPVN